jgi:DNA-binding HxlR family transcriptional regulator
VLADRLAELTHAGLITRTVDVGPPVSVSYALTDCGAALMPALRQIAQWAEEHLSADEG